MGIHVTTVQVAVIIFFATIIRSAFGFGEALFAVPLLALIMPIRVAVAVATLISVTVALFIVAQDWQKIHARSAGWLLLSTVFGIPLGLVIVKTVAEPLGKGVLAVVILSFALFSVLVRNPPELKSDRWAWLFGFIAGILGGAYSMNGPPLVVYGSLRRWSPERFRATLQGYFLPGSAFVVAGYWIAGLLTAAVFHYYLLTLPVVVVAIFIGRTINRRLDSRRFRTSLNIALMIVGSVLLAQALHHP